MADRRVELVRAVLDNVPIRPAQHDLDRAAHDIIRALDDAHNHDERFVIDWSDETEEPD